MTSKKVLVVDDSNLIHRMFDMMLRQYQLVHARDGREGLERLAEQKDFGVILLDINMPRMNGLEFLGAVKADPALAGIPVVIITTEGTEDDTRRGMEAGAAAYVRKPFRNEEVLGVINRLTASPAA
ncbi:MAG TPA: response regulator [Anaeromyxobacteraceae bacterium]|jgi:CheY-like chemotaxis protein|nr:response regulator [Anaeromyxobacteraceae bacterium]